MNEIISLIENNPQSVSKRIAERVRERRLEMNLTQKGLAERAGMKLPTYRSFERTGMVSLRGLMQIAFALNMMQDFEQLFAQKQYKSIDDVLLQLKPKPKPMRKRGSRK